MAAPTLEAIRYRPGDLQVLNQLLLPHATSYDQIVTIEDAWHCIRDMRVRGAPAIAIVAALALAVQLRARTFASVPELQAFVTTSWEHLKACFFFLKKSPKSSGSDTPRLSSDLPPNGRQPL